MLTMLAALAICAAVTLATFPELVAGARRRLRRPVVATSSPLEQLAEPDAWPWPRRPEVAR